MLDWSGQRTIRRSSAHEAWPAERDPARLLERAKADIAASLGPACRANALGRAIRVLDLVEAARETPLLQDPQHRARVLGGLRTYLLDALESERLDSAAARARASFLLELLLSLCESPPRPETDFPGVETRARDVSLRLGLNLRGGAIVRCQLAQSLEGDCGDPGREPHLALGFFAGLLGGERRPIVERMVRLARRLVRGRVWRVDFFLWFHVFDRARRSGAGDDVRALFARNARLEVEVALRELLADAEAVERMLADGQDFMPGTAPGSLRDDDVRALDRLRSAWPGEPPRRWVHVGDPLGALSIGDVLRLEGSTSVVTRAPGAGEVIRRVLPLARDPALRILEDAEVERVESRLRESSAKRSEGDPLEVGMLRRLRGKRGPLLLTDLGGLLGVVAPFDHEAARRADANGASAARYGAMAFAEAVLSALGPGDTAVFLGTGGVPYLRSATWLQLSIRDDRRVSVSAIAWRQRFPGFESRWEARVGTPPRRSSRG
jgi:hypothetical protein